MLFSCTYQQISLEVRVPNLAQLLNSSAFCADEIPHVSRDVAILGDHHGTIARERSWGGYHQFKPLRSTVAQMRGCSLESVTVVV